MENAIKQGKRLMDGLRKLQQRVDCIGDVRGLGLMVGVEMVEDPESKKPARERRGRLISRAFEKGLLLLGCGENSIRFCPALTVDAEEIDACLSIFEACLQET
jgi:4-aminobutyrate aminotransferase